MGNCQKCGEQTDRYKSGRCKPCARKSATARHRMMRGEVYKALGGAICKGCGYDEIEELSIDHVNNDGKTERLEIINLKIASGRWKSEKRLKLLSAGYNAGNTGQMTGHAFLGYMYRNLRQSGSLDLKRYQILCPTCQARKRNGKMATKHVQQLTANLQSLIPKKDKKESKPKNYKVNVSFDAESQHHKYFLGHTDIQ